MTYNLVRGWAPLRGVLVQKDKYVDQPIPELYDLAGDPKEERNLAPQRADRVQVLVNVLRTFNVAPPNRPGHESAEVAATLRSLGYVSGSAPERKVFTEADDLKNLVQVDRDLHTASSCTRRARSQDAIALLNGVIARRPDTADAYISLAHAYWESGQLQPAIATLEKALANGAPDRDVRIRLGIYLAESQTDPARAIKLLEGIPVSDVEALNGLGVAYGGAGRYADAIEAFKKVLALDPTNGLAYQNMASMVLRQALASKNEQRPTQASCRRLSATRARRSRPIRRCPRPTRRSASRSQNLDGRARPSTAGNAPSRSTAASSMRCTTSQSCCSRRARWTRRARMRSSSCRRLHPRYTGRPSSRCGSFWGANAQALNL